MTSQKSFKKAFCGELLSCLIDTDSKFSYFGVIIKMYKKSNYKQTFKNLWKDESNLDPNVIFKEKVIIELESEKFNDVLIGNGYIALQNDRGSIYTIDYTDNITLLYSRNNVLSSIVSNNSIFSVCQEKVNKTDLFLNKWEPKTSKKTGDTMQWTTYVFKIKESLSPTLSLLFSRNNEFILFSQGYDISSQFESSLGKSQSTRKQLDKSVDISSIMKLSESWDIATSKSDSSLNNVNVMTLFETFDDSYNIRYKRIKNLEGVKAPTKSSFNLLNMSVQNFEKNLRKAEMKTNTSMILDERRLFRSNSSEKTNKLIITSPKDKTCDDSDAERKIRTQMPDMSPIYCTKKDSANMFSVIQDKFDKNQLNEVETFDLQEKIMNIKKKALTSDFYHGNSNETSLPFNITANKVGDLYLFLDIITKTFLKKHFDSLSGNKKKFDLKSLIEDVDFSRKDSLAEDAKLGKKGESQTSTSNITAQFMKLYMKKNIDIMISNLVQLEENFLLKSKKLFYSSLKTYQRKPIPFLSITRADKDFVPRSENVYSKPGIVNISPRTFNLQKTPSNLRKSTSLENERQVEISKEQQEMLEKPNKSNKIEDEEGEGFDSLESSKQLTPKGNPNEISSINQPRSNDNLILIENQSNNDSKAFGLADISAGKSMDLLTLRSQNEVFQESNMISHIHHERVESEIADSNRKILDKFNAGKVEFHETISESSGVKSDSRKNSNYSRTANKNEVQQIPQASDQVVKTRFNELKPKVNIESKNLFDKDPFIKEVNKTSKIAENEDLSKVPQIENENEALNESENKLFCQSEKNLIDKIDGTPGVYFSKVKMVRRREKGRTMIEDYNRKANQIPDLLSRIKDNHKITNHNATMNVFANNTQTKEINPNQDQSVGKIKDGDMERQEMNFAERPLEFYQDNLSTIENKGSLILSHNFNQTELFTENNRNSCQSNQYKGTIPVTMSDNPFSDKAIKTITSEPHLDDNEGFKISLKKAESTEGTLKEQKVAQTEQLNSFTTLVPHRLTVSQGNKSGETNGIEGNFNFSGLSKPAIDENQHDKVKNLKYNDLKSQASEEYKSEPKSKNYNFNLDLKNVLSKLPKEEDSERSNISNKGKKQPVFKSSTKKVSNNVNESPSKEPYLVASNTASTKTSPKLKDKFKSKQESPLKIEVPIEHFNYNSSEPQNREPTIFQNSNPNQSSQKTEKSTESYIFDKFEKNINLPLSTGFHNIIHTPRFKNKNINQSHDTLNSENNNSPNKKDSHFFKTEKAEDNRLIRSAMMNIPGKIESIENSIIQDIRERSSSPNKGLHALDRKDSFKGVCKIEEFMPERDNKQEIAHPTSQESLKDLKNVVKRNSIKEITRESLGIDFNKQTFQKINPEQGQGQEIKIPKINIIRERSPERVATKKSSNEKVAKESHLSPIESSNNIENKSKGSSNNNINLNNSVYLKKKRPDKFSNKSIASVAVPNKVTRNEALDESHNIFFDSQVMTQGCNKSVNINSDQNISAVYFKPGQMPDNFFQTNSTVELLVSHRSNINPKENINNLMNIREEEVVESKKENSLCYSKKIPSSKEGKHINVSKVYEEDLIDRKVRLTDNQEGVPPLDTQNNVSSSFDNSNNTNNIPISANTYESIKIRESNKKLIEVQQQQRKSILSQEPIFHVSAERPAQNKTEVIEKRPEFSQINLNDLRNYVAETKGVSSSKKETGDQIKINLSKNSVMKFNSSSKVNSKKKNESAKVNAVVIFNDQKDLRLNNSVNIAKPSVINETPKVPLKNHSRKVSEHFEDNTPKPNPHLIGSQKKNSSKMNAKVDTCGSEKQLTEITSQKKGITKMVVFLLEKLIKGRKKLFFSKFNSRTLTLSPSISRTYIEISNTISDRRPEPGKDQSNSKLNPKKNLNEQFIQMTKRRVYSSKIIMKVLRRRIIFFKIIFLNRVFQLFLKNQIHQINVEQLFSSNDDVY